MHPLIISECLVAVVVFGSGIVDESHLLVVCWCLVLPVLRVGVGVGVERAGGWLVGGVPSTLLGV